MRLRLSKVDAEADSVRGRIRLTWPRNLVLFQLAAIILCVGPAYAGFDFDEVARKAAKLAESPFEEPKGLVPAWLRNISEEEWKDIRFRPEHALWRKRRLRFDVEFFHPGLVYDRVVKVNVVDASGVYPVQFSPSQFDYGKNTFSSRVPQDLGYAGFRLNYPLFKPKQKDPVLVFLGASYYRAVGKNQVFGLSARGLAVDTGLPSGEEFPYFKEFWIVEPADEAKDISVYALLDSRRVTGAYRFTVFPGEETVVHVESRLFLRERVEKLGIAPLTSMFFFGKNTVERPLDFRPEVHNSDGLLVATRNGEWIWRPLMNPRTLVVSRLELTDAKGFGLLQRDREFDHYQQFRPRLDLRPSAWITPDTGWGEGSIELVEIPTPSQDHDNIVAFWIPSGPVEPGEPLAFSYTTHWLAVDPRLSPAGRIAATRRDKPTRDGAHRFVIDFTGSKLERLPAETVLRAVLSIGSGSDKEGEVLEQEVLKNPVTGGWRLFLEVLPKTKNPLDLRVFLQKDREPLTETWFYRIVP